jgi:hypothetical protein
MTLQDGRLGGRSAKKISKVIEKVLEQKDDEPEVDIFDSVINM